MKIIKKIFNLDKVQSILIGFIIIIVCQILVFPIFYIDVDFMTIIQIALYFTFIKELIEGTCTIKQQKTKEEING